MLVTSLFLVFISMQFSDSQAGDLGTGLSLRNPVIPHPSSISYHIPHPDHCHTVNRFSELLCVTIFRHVQFYLVETVFYTSNSDAGKTREHLPLNWEQIQYIQRDISSHTRCFAIIEDCTVHIVLPLFTSIAVKICPPIPLSLQRCCLGLAITILGFHMI